MNSKNKDNFIKLIRGIGVKVTQQRMTILEHIFNGKKHVTAQDVFEKVKITSPEIGFATVYRFLRTLSDHKILTELRMNGLPARYEWANKKHHDHLSCKSCGKIVEFENNEIETLQLQVANKHGFKLLSHVLELYGTCPSCLIEEKIPKEPTSFVASSAVL